MSVAFFGFVRSKPAEIKRPDGKESWIKDCNRIWARRLDSLEQLLDSESDEKLNLCSAGI